jgi:autotransporter passenger strand-loop-strand repeat protein
VNGGIASATMVSSGGSEIVVSGGIARGTIVDSGGVQRVISGTASGTVVNGGTENIVSRGIASGSIVSSGGVVYVASGGVASGAFIDGGTIEVAKGGSIGSGAVTFASGGGMLMLNQSTAFVGLVAGFGGTDKLDLADIVFTWSTSPTFAEAASLTSGTLTVTNGASTAKIVLLGQYATSNFHLSGDGHAGTMVTDPSAPASLSLTSPGHT